jgi:hypothetical protein
VYAQIPDNNLGFGFIYSTVCDDWEEVASFCGGNECSSDCDCNVGFECECDGGSISSSDDDRRFLVEFQKQVMGHQSQLVKEEMESKVSSNSPPDTADEAVYASLIASTSSPPLDSIKHRRRVKSDKHVKSDDEDDEVYISSFSIDRSDKGCKSVKSCKSSKGDGPYCLSELFPDVPRVV